MTNEAMLLVQDVVQTRRDRLPIGVQASDCNHPSGITRSKLETLMSAGEFKNFLVWMRGQTAALSDRGEEVFYLHDVQDFQQGKAVSD